MVTQKISVIGLDGATFNVLEPMMRRGILPNISKLVENGASGNLETYITGMGHLINLLIAAIFSFPLFLLKWFDAEISYELITGLLILLIHALYFISKLQKDTKIFQQFFSS